VPHRLQRSLGQLDHQGMHVNYGHHPKT
jgi:hypothetical protein